MNAAFMACPDPNGPALATCLCDHDGPGFAKWDECREKNVCGKEVTEDITGGVIDLCVAEGKDVCGMKHLAPLAGERCEP